MPRDSGAKFATRPKQQSSSSPLSSPAMLVANELPWAVYNLHKNGRLCWNLPVTKPMSNENGDSIDVQSALLAILM